MTQPNQSDLKKHEHNFVAEKYTVQEYVHKYAGNDKYDKAILSHEKIKLFCTKCGKVIDVEEVESDQPE